MRSDLITTKQLAAQLGLSTATVRDYARTGKLRPALITPGGHRRYRLPDVRQQLARPADLQAVGEVPASRAVVETEMGHGYAYDDEGGIRLGEQFAGPGESRVLLEADDSVGLALEVAALAGPLALEEGRTEPDYAPDDNPVLDRLHRWAGSVVPTSRGVLA